MQNDSSATVQLSIGEVLSNGFSIGMRNFVSLVLTMIVFALTFWIPYLNIGTFIALQDIVPKMSRGERIGPGDIFDAKYRSSIGEFFLLAGLFYGGVIFGAIFMGIGALVVSMSWMFAMPLLVDRGIGPIDALRMSNRATYGNKATIFFSMLFLYVIVIAITLLAGLADRMLGTIIGGIAGLLTAPIGIGMAAYLYGRLTPHLDAPAPGFGQVAAAGMPI